MLITSKDRRSTSRALIPSPTRTSIRPGVYSLFNLSSWPGNIRELENVIEPALVLDKDGVLGLDDLPDRLGTREQCVGNVRIELADEGVSLERIGANCF